MFGKGKVKRVLSQDLLLQSYVLQAARGNETDRMVLIHATSVFKNSNGGEMSSDEYDQIKRYCEDAIAAAAGDRASK